MIGREVVLFGRRYVWELRGRGVVNGETQVQWYLAHECEHCGWKMLGDERHGLVVNDGGPDAWSIVCLDPFGDLLGPARRPCGCHGLIACPDPPDPPF